MKLFLKKYMLFIVAASLALVPMTQVAAKSTTQQTAKQQQAKESKRKKYVVKKSTRKKVSYKKSRKARKAARERRRIALAKQRAIDLGENYDGSMTPDLASNVALVVNQDTGEIKYAKNAYHSASIASITKLMTAMVVLDAQQDMHEFIYISDQDVDQIKGTRSRLPVGSSLTRADMLQLALMSSENRAAYALSTNYPGGRDAFVKAMNAKALSIGLLHTRFSEPTGLMYQNRSTAEDLYMLVAAAYQYPEIRQATTTTEYEIYIDGNERSSLYKNTNKLVREGNMDIGLSKTGFINEAGRCVVMQTVMAGEPMIVVLLDAAGTNKRTGDVNRLRKWFEYKRDHTIIAEVDDEDLSPQLVMSSQMVEEVDAFSSN